MSTSAEASTVHSRRSLRSQLLRRRGQLLEVGRPATRTQADLNEERLWASLEQGTVTLKELRESEIRSPAQEIYDLQLAGYAIDRLRVPDGPGQSTVAYRLRTRTVAGIEPC